MRAAMLAGLMTTIAMWASVAPAGATTPPQIVHTQVNVSLPGIEQCGFTVNSVVKGTDTFQVFFDSAGNMSFQDVAHVVSTMTNVANGKVVYVDSAGRDSFGGPGVLNPDGTTTFTDVLTGRDIRIYTSHSSVLVKDVGYLAILTTVDSEGNFVGQQLVTHGPHQFAGDFTVYCNAIAAAIG